MVLHVTSALRRSSEKLRAEDRGIADAALLAAIQERELLPQTPVGELCLVGLAEAPQGERMTQLIVSVRKGWHDHGERH